MNMFAGSGVFSFNTVNYSVSGSLGYRAQSGSVKDQLEEILLYTKYNKSDLANMLKIGRTTIYNYLDNKNPHSDHTKSIAKMHLVMMRYIVEGGDSNFDFIKTELPDGQTFADYIGNSDSPMSLGTAEIDNLQLLAQHSKMIAKTKERLRNKFAQV